MTFKDKTNSKFFIYEGNWIISDLMDTPPRLIVNTPELDKAQTIVRLNTFEQYNQFINDNNISIASTYEQDGEIIEVPRAPFQSNPTQQKGVLNLGDDIWVLKLYQGKGVLYPFCMPTGMFIPLNELDYGFEQEIVIFSTEAEANEWIGKTYTDMSEAFRIEDLMG